MARTKNATNIPLNRDRSEDDGRRASTHVTPLATIVAALETQDVGTLRATWQRLHRASPPDRISRDLLARDIAYRLQEVALGGLRPAAKRKLAAWSGSLADADGKQSQSAAPAAAVRLKRGATLIRTWRAVTHTVQVGEDGFEHQGVRYASLSQIAQVITGTHWSGPRFFGQTGAPRSKVPAATKGEDDADAPIF